MDGVLCPVVVGRAVELAALAGLVADAADGRGGVAVLVGEAGVGKSRLAREAAALAAGRGVLVLSGRAVPAGSPLPFRPLSEAMLVASRGKRPPDSPELTGFGGQLARLVPDWGTGDTTGGADNSPVLVGEAVVRLLRVLGGTAGCLLVLEDLHWADPETLAVVDYLADTLAAERALCLATTRSAGPSHVADVLDRLRSRRVGTVLPLAPLSDGDCADMVRACLSGAEEVDRAVPAFVAEHSDGLPFLIEELLAGLVTSGALTREDGRWRAEQAPTPSVPASFAASLGTRLQTLDPDARHVLAAAAVLGRRFDWDLLPGVAAVDGATVVGSLRRAVDAQLVAVDGQRFRFRHALTREAVLAELLPPERAELSGRALVAVHRAHPGLPGPWCELAAELAEGAGDRETAAALTTESAHRALARGALASAELTAERARSLASPGSAAAAEAEEVLVTVLAHAGKPGPARALGHGLLHRLDELGAPPPRRVELLLVLVRAALAAGDTDSATADVASARATGDLDPGVRAALDAVGAHVALADDRLDEARRLASAAVSGADRPEVECEALEVLGRLATASDSVALFRRSADLAERHGLTTWRLRALQELALTEATPDGDHVRELRRVAADAGAHLTIAQMDLVLADMALNAFDRDTCREAAERCADASRRYGLASLPVALLWLAGGHALDGSRDGDGGRAGRGRCRGSRRCPDGGRRLGARARHLPRAARGPRRAAARTGAVHGVHASRTGDGVGLPGTVLVGAAARVVRRRSRPGRASRDRGVPARPDRVRRRLRWRWSTRSCSAGRAGPPRRAPPSSGPARRSVNATGRGTACASWPRARYATAGASRSSGYGRPRRSSRTAVTTGSPGSAGPCSSPPVRRPSAADGAGRPFPLRCAGSASPAASSTCSSSSPTRCPRARSPPACSSPRARSSTTSPACWPAPAPAPAPSSPPSPAQTG